MGKVRGLGVRGLGDRQYKERLMTKYKIVSFLDVSPFTYEQLWRVSSIQRNVLRKNLDLLVEEGTVLEHKYSIPYTEEFYGYMYKYPVSYMTPLCGHKYYLLDCSQRQCEAYMNFYYNNKIRERRKPFNKIFMKERQKRRQKLCIYQSETGEISAELQMKEISELQMKEMTSSEIRDDWQKCMELRICLEREWREREIIAVKIGKRFGVELTYIDGDEENSATEIAEFFTKKGYSLLDVLIRCCTERTTISTGYISSYLNLALIRYCLLWRIIEKAGLLRNFSQAR
jgi:hypothetical protein